jgi:hypothetical protein
VLVVVGVGVGVEVEVAVCVDVLVGLFVTVLVGVAVAVGVPVAVGEGVTLAVGVGDGIGVGVTLAASTVMVPRMPRKSCSVQTYVYTPGVSKVRTKVSPGGTASESHAPASPVLVWDWLLAFRHVTVSPR